METKRYYYLHLNKYHYGMVTWAKAIQSMSSHLGIA